MTSRKRKPCYQCGEAGHRARDCPKASVECQVQISRATKSPPPVDRGQFSAATTAQTQQQAKGFTFAELFAGIGGFRVALEKLGGRCVFASEVDRFCVANYQRNFGNDRPAGDITRIESNWIPQHDVLVGGFPCQPFSSSGSRKGMEDPKGVLFREIARILRDKQPRAFILENVRGLYLHDNGSTFEIIRKELEECGYTVNWDLVDAVNLLPQERCRLFIVGIRRDLVICGEAADGRRTYEFPKLPNLQRGVMDILHSQAGPDALPRDELERLALSAHQVSKVKSQPYTQQHPEARFLSDLSSAAKTLQSSYTKYMVGSQFVPDKLEEGENKSISSSSSQSMTSNDDHLLQWRRFSSREAARIQGFPETFHLCPQRAYHILGNAVAPPVIAMIAAPLLQLIELAAKQNVQWGWTVTKQMLLEAVPNDERKELLCQKLETCKS